jgi:nucleoside-diphosphate-sugar epimerase
VRVLVTGATGTIGSPVAQRFRAEGCDVLGLARSDASAERLRAAGIEPVAGSIDEPDQFAGAIRSVDVVVHAAYTFDARAAAADLSTIRAVGEHFRGTGKAFLYTSGLWLLGDVGPEPATEDAPVNPAPTVRFRPVAEEMVLALAQEGVRSFAIRPGVVYGSTGGLVAELVASGRQRGAVRFVGSGDEMWPLVHQSDLGALYWLVLQRAEPGTIWHGVSTEGVPVRELALAAAEAAGIPGCIEPWPVDEAVAELGDFAYALALDQTVSGARARQLLGWNPTGPSAFEELSAAAAPGHQPR